MPSPPAAAAAAAAGTTAAAANPPERSSDLNSDEEISGCDYEKLHEIAEVQGGAGHLLFICYPANIIVAHDTKIQEVSWIRYNVDGEDQQQPYPDPESTTDETTTAPRIPQMCGMPLNAWVPAQLCQMLLDSMVEMKMTCAKRTFRFFTHQQKHFAISLSTVDPSTCNMIGIEIEPAETSMKNSNALGNLLGQLGRIIEVYDNTTIAFTACDTVFDVMAEYDRGMVYKFNDDLSGEVIHEIKRDGIASSYLGLRFPAGDIPLSAREMYKENGLRYIQDVESEIVPLASRSMEAIDMSQIRMRAVSRCHILYMRNMGVRCSLSIAIIVENKLWGLLAFHGYKRPFKPQLHQRIACETISRMVSVKIDSVVKKTQSNRIVRLSEALLAYQPSRSLIQNLYEIADDILLILDCEVLVIFDQNTREHDGDVLVLGDKSLTPEDSFWEKMSTQPNREICSINKREQLKTYGLEESDCPASGIVFFREGRTQFMLGRVLRSKDVKWGGDPDTPKLRIGGILNPRASFDVFMEKAKLEARAWNDQDLNVISAFRDRMCEHSHSWMLELLRHDIADTNKKYLAAIDRAQDNYDFFARMSHELRTPFHGVIGCLGILEDADGDMSRDDTKTVIKTAMSSANHMINLLNDILDVSKNEHLSHTVLRAKVIFQSLAFEAYDCMKPLADSQNINLEWEVCPNDDKIMISTDRTKMIQIVSNLVSNAVKFTDKEKGGGIRVNFSLEQTLQDGIKKWSALASSYDGSVFSLKEGEMLTKVRDVQDRVSAFPNLPDKGWICVSIIDSGCGMKPESLIDMFSPYTQASTGSNRGFQGTGLGLFICVSLCIQMNGYIACSSTPDFGTAFQIGIPVDLEHKSRSEQSEETPEPFVTAEPVPLRECILVADDNNINVQILKRTLETLLKKDARSLAVEIVTASGGEEALAIYKERRPSPCFIDYHMPDMDGLATTSEIRKFEKENGLLPSYILSYTADATDRAKELLFKNGINDIMLKPPPRNFVVDLVARLVMESKEV